MTVLDIFAGPGGWDVAAAKLGIPDLVGIEWDEAACATAEAAGHKRRQADVSMIDLSEWDRIDGLIGSPPCQSYSTAGKGLGKLDKPRILAHVERIRKAGRWLHYSRDGWHDARSPLVLEPLRYALTLRPTWIALEQVPAVLPLWEAFAEILREHGYSADCGNLSAEQYGVPQTRKRAFLIAHRECGVGLPVPTHRKYRKGVARSEGDPSLSPWVSMADALGWGMTARPGMTVTGGGSATGGAEPFGNAARQGIKREHDAGNWQMRGSNLPNATVRDIDEPAPTIIGGNDTAQRVWSVRFGNQAHSAVREIDEPAATIRYGERANACDWLMARNSGPGAERDPRSAAEDPSYTIRANGSGSHPSGVEWHLRSGQSIAGEGRATRKADEPAVTVSSTIGRAQWVHDAPATTVQGDPRIAPRGHHDRQVNGETVRVTVQEAAVLQSFPADYPWQGTKTAQYRQVGDAVPPLLAEAILRSVWDEDD